MSRYYGGWGTYVPVAERRKRAEQAVAKMAKQGQATSPVKITGKQIASSFWGKAWCDNLESYQDFENRLPRGRTYVRNGSVLDLQIRPGEIRAMVSGSSLYRVTVSIGALSRAQWQATCRDCASGIDSLVELLQGRFSKGVMERICQQGKGLFPKPSEIKFSCSCPDYAFMCKHVAAVLYGVGARLDEQPDLLFQLRAVDQRELVTNLDSPLPLSKNRPDAARVLVDDDISALFGLEMASGDTPVETEPKAAARRKKITRREAATGRIAATTVPVIPAKSARPTADLNRPKASARTKLVAGELQQAVRKAMPKQGSAGSRPTGDKTLARKAMPQQQAEKGTPAKLGRTQATSRLAAKTKSIKPNSSSHTVKGRSTR